MSDDKHGLRGWVGILGLYFLGAAILGILVGLAAVDKLRPLAEQALQILKRRIET
jgi:hypothetical protein